MLYSTQMTKPNYVQLHLHAEKTFFLALQLYPHDEVSKVTLTLCGLDKPRLCTSALPTKKKDQSKKGYSIVVKDLFYMGAHQTDLAITLNNVKA